MVKLFKFMIAFGIIGFLVSLIVFSIDFCGGPTLFNYAVTAIWSAVFLTGGAIMLDYRQNNA